MAVKERAIVFLSPGFPRDETDSTCLTERQIFIKALKSADPSLQIIVLAFQYPHFNGFYRWHGINVYSFNIGYKGNFRKLIGWLAIFFRLRIIERKYSLAAVFSFWLGECAYLAQRFKGSGNNIKHYCWLLGQDARAGNKYVRKTGIKADQLIALSDSLADEFFKNYMMHPRYVIPTGTDPSLFNRLNYERTIDILGVGSLIPLKQYHIFLEVVQKANETFPFMKVVLCGEGPEKEKLKDMVKTLKLEKVVEFKGELDHKEILTLMQQTNIFLHTSAYEGYATVISEALCAGAEVVTFCRPMHQSIKHFHVVNSKNEMIQTVCRFLKNHMDHEPVLPYNVHKAALNVLKLLNHQAGANEFKVSSNFLI